MSVWEKLRAAGLNGLPFSIEDDERLVDHGLDPEQKARIEAILRENPPARTKLLAAAALARYRAEIGGITVENIAVSTDRQSQALIMGATMAAQAGPKNATFQWKTGMGFIEISRDQVLAIAAAVAAHVQRCFAKEAEISAAIEAGSINDDAAVVNAFADISPPVARRARK